MVHARVLIVCLLTLVWPLLSTAEELRFDTAADWRRWEIPEGAVQITPAGTLQPIRARRDIDAAANAGSFGGGIRVTERRYNKLIPSFRGGVDTLISVDSDWSPWSNPYNSSGALYESPSPRRYAELDVRLISDSPEAAASLDWVSLQIQDAIAEGAVSEIYPVQVAPGVEREFSFFVCAPVTARGFDAIDVEASTPMNFTLARRNGAALAVTSEPIDCGFRIQFSDRVQSNELVELSFSASLYLPSTRFEAYLVDRDLGQGVRQQVEAGDATAEVSSSTDVVRFPVTQGMLVNLTISPSAMTPNGDGFNDRLVVTADIVNLVAQRPIRLQVFDLAGRTVWEATQRCGTGPYSIEWDGRRASGTLVSPGSYVVRIEAEGDAATKSSVWVLAILY